MKYVRLKIIEYLIKIMKGGIDGNINTDSSVLWRAWSNWGFLFFIILIYIYRAMGYIGPTMAPDAETTYLPYAQRAISEGLNFLFHKDSILVAPMSYFWPALLGGKVLSIKYANLICGLIMVLLVYGIGRRMHSHAAGLIASFLFARSPLLIPWIPTALSEPPFYLFTFIWIWAIGEVIAKRKWAIPIASVALSVSILARPVWFYPSIIFLLAAFIWFWLKQRDRDLARSLIIVQLTGLILPVAVIIKNIILFDFPSIALGSGLALYFGTNIMTGGFEPPLLGLSYISGLNPMTIVGNHEHMLVAMEFFRDRSLFESLEWFTQKISWILMFTPLDASIKISVWRAIELAMVLIGFWWGVRQKSYFIIIMGAGLVLQIFQTSLVLYNVRYSTDNIELLLVPLAAVGIVVFLRSAMVGVNHDYTNNFLFRSNTFLDYRKLGIVLIVIFLSIIYFKLRPSPEIKLPKNIPVTTLFKRTNKTAIDILSTTGANQSSQWVVKLYIPKQVRPEIRPGEENNVLWEIRMSISAKSDEYCKKTTIGFSPSHSIKNNFYSTTIPVSNDGFIHSYYIGTTYANSALFPKKSGRLILKFDCDPGVDIQIKKISLIVPHFVEYYWNKVVH